MDLYSFLEDRLINGRHSFISVTGGGGKTTFLISFGEWLKNKGKSILLTTTTKLASPLYVDYHVDSFCSSIDAVCARKGASLSFAHIDESTGKLIYPGRDELASVESLFDVVIAEADGSRGLPIKVHSKRDPVIPEETTAVVSIIGGWGVGKKSFDVVFGEKRDLVVDRDYLIEFLSSPEGPCKGMRDDTTNIILINGYDIMSEEQIDVVSSLVFPRGVEAFLVSERKGEVYRAL